MSKDTYIPRNEVVDIHKEIDLVRAKAVEELMKLPGVIAVGVGLKEVKGQIQRQPCFKVKVEKKKDRSALTKAGMVPPELYGFKTDVTELTLGTAAAKDEAKYRPLIAGSQLEGSGTAARKGTLGCFATRNSDGKLVILSNWHILVGSPDQIDGDRGGQPSHNGCCSCCATNEIGTVTDGRFRTDNLDAAILLLNGQDTDAIPEERYLNEMLEIGAIAGSTAPLSMETVYKRGRSTLLTSGQITDDNVPHDTQYESYNNLIIPRSGQFEVTPSAAHVDYFIHGDSGSVSVNEHNQAVLLNYSFVAASHKGFGSNIKTVEAALGISVLHSSFHGSVAGKEGVLLTSAAYAPQSANLSGALAEMEAALSGSREGLRLLELFKTHRTELLDLVRHKREVMAAWNRYQGPAYLSHIARHLRTEDKPVPEQIKGITLQSLLLKMAAVLQRNASAPLAGTVAENYLQVMQILSAGRSHRDWQAYLQHSDNRTYA